MTTETTASNAAAEAETAAANAAIAAAPAVNAPASVPAAAAPSPEITLRQFARETSARDKRMTLLHGFVFEEELARRFKDTEANYSARFAAFANKPV